jgi:hypothetical protein
MFSAIQNYASNTDSSQLLGILKNMKHNVSDTGFASILM